MTLAVAPNQTQKSESTIKSMCKTCRLRAVLPCYWIYWEVGKALLEEGSPNPPVPEVDRLSQR